MSVVPDRKEVSAPMAEPVAELDMDLTKKNLWDACQSRLREKYESIISRYSKSKVEFARLWQGMTGPPPGFDDAFRQMKSPQISLDVLTELLNQVGNRSDRVRLGMVLGPADYNKVRPDYRKKSMHPEDVLTREEIEAFGVQFNDGKAGPEIDPRFKEVDPPKGVISDGRRSPTVYGKKAETAVSNNGDPVSREEIYRRLFGDSNQQLQIQEDGVSNGEVLVPEPHGPQVEQIQDAPAEIRKFRLAGVKAFIENHKPQIEIKRPEFRMPDVNIPHPNINEILKFVSGAGKIRRPEINIPNPVQPLSKIFKEVTGHKIGDRAVGDYAKDVGIRGVLSFGVGIGLGTVGVIGIPAALLGGAGVSGLMEIRRQNKDHERDIRKLLFAAGTGAAFGVAGGVVGVLGLSETGVGQAVKGALGMVGEGVGQGVRGAVGVAGDLLSSGGNLKDEAWKVTSSYIGSHASGLATTFEGFTQNISQQLPTSGETVATSMPEVTGLSSEVASTSLFIEPGNYSPSIEIPDNAHEWMKDANNPEGAYATAIQAEVGKNVGEVGKDLSYIEYGLQRGLEMRGLSINGLDQNILDSNRHRLLGVLEDAANWAFDRHLQDAVRMNLSLDEMIDLGRDTFDEWLDIHGLDELAREVDLDLKQAA